MIVCECGVVAKKQAKKWPKINLEVVALVLVDGLPLAPGQPLGLLPLALLLEQVPDDVTRQVGPLDQAGVVVEAGEPGGLQLLRHLQKRQTEILSTRSRPPNLRVQRFFTFVNNSSRVKRDCNQEKYCRRAANP